MPKIDQKALDKFLANIHLVSSGLSKFLADMIKNNQGLHAEEIVYALMSTASFICQSTKCDKETYLKLSEAAFNDCKEQDLKKDLN